MNQNTQGCINCGTEVDTPYCPSCGQRNPPKKLSFVTLWVDFQSRIYGFDGMFPRTLKDLTLRPGKAAREFINGNRVKYYGPVGYFFLMLTVFLLLMSILGIDFIEYMRNSNPVGTLQQSDNKAANEIQMEIMRVITDNMKIFSFMIIFFIVLWTKIFYRKSSYNLLEHSVLPFYTMGHFYWLSIISLASFKLTGYSGKQSMFLIIQIIYFAWAISGFYPHSSRWKGILKGLAIYILGFLSYMIFTSLMAMLYVYTDPGMRKLIER